MSFTVKSRLMKAISAAKENMNEADQPSLKSQFLAYLSAMAKSIHKLFRTYQDAH